MYMYARMYIHKEGKNYYVNKFWRENENNKDMYVYSEVCARPFTKTKLLFEGLRTLKAEKPQT